MSRTGPIAKLTAPRVHQAVTRPRVSKVIDRALRSGHCWVAAPAGYGKTTALAEYLTGQKITPYWYRVDEGDQDVAAFFFFMAQSLRSAAARKRLPAFGPEYVDQAKEFARRFFRAYFSEMESDAFLVLDDLHNADAPTFRSIIAVLLREAPAAVRCVLLSRTLPFKELADFFSAGVSVVDQSILQFSATEARTLIAQRIRTTTRAINVTAARGWAAGLVLLAEQGSATVLPERLTLGRRTSQSEAAIFAALAHQLFDTLPSGEKELLLKLSLLPEITFDLANRLSDAETTRASLERLVQRQLLITRSESSRAVFRLHDLLREFLRHQSSEQFSTEELSQLYERTVHLLESTGYADEAINLALQGNLWPLARHLIVQRAESLLAQGRHVTLIDWCSKLPDSNHDAWLCYWLGVANMAEDATAEKWLSKAWVLFSDLKDVRGQSLAAVRAVLSKTDSWRTHEGLSPWTRRVLDLLESKLPELRDDEQLLIWSGMIRAIDFAEDYRTDTPAAKQLTQRLFERLANPKPGDSTTLRLQASETLMEHAGSTGKIEIFEKAVDSVALDLRDRNVSPWALGLWLVAFGAVSGRYFPYNRRGFPYATAEDALRAAIAIGERESLRGVEFGALYHLQYLMKLRNDFAEFESLIARLAKIADSRYSTQVAVGADCRAALHTMQENFREAYRDCERFMTTIEAANEPPIERWPHFITYFQVLLADRKPNDAAKFLEERLPLFDGGVLHRSTACISLAKTFAAKWASSPDYETLLGRSLADVRAANWHAVLMNLPKLLSELCADAFERNIEVDFCRQLVSRRSLSPPASRPPLWPWSLKVRVLGEFRLECDGSTLDLGAKPPTRSLDIIRALAVAKDHTCSLEQLYEWLWPDADGDQAKAACEQALHRLRKLLGKGDLILQREGKIRFASEKVWVDLEAWESKLKHTLQLEIKPGETASRPEVQLELRLERLFERLLFDFPGPLLHSERGASWLLPAAERVRSKFTDLTTRLGKRLEASKELAKARTVYLRAIDMYPTSEKCFEALLRLRLSDGDVSGAVEDYRRYERIMASSLQTAPSRSIRALIAPYLSSTAIRM